MKNLSTLIDNERKKSKDQRLKLDIALRLSRLNTEDSAVLIVNKIGSFFKITVD